MTPAQFNSTDTDYRLSRHDQNVKAMFGNISRWYDFLNHFLSLGMDFYWRKRLVSEVQTGSNRRILDLAAGTLDVCKKLSENFPDHYIHAADLSAKMLIHGLKKDTLGRIIPVCADAKTLPFAENSFDCITISFGIRNVLPRSLAYSEILRILTPGGKLCILEFGSGRQKIWGGIYNFYLSRVLPCLGKIISRDKSAYSYLASTIRNFPGPEEIKEELREAGFSNTGYKGINSGIVFLHTAHKSDAPPKINQ